MFIFLNLREFNFFAFLNSDMGQSVCRGFYPAPLLRLRNSRAVR